ncbi:hypothetical protein FACS1894201_03580 [Bacteroidia bacterium]|nr:hypothetical protein FACS1894201_03580 [Bacteroidia bacterium]
MKHKINKRKGLLLGLFLLGMLCRIPVYAGDTLYVKSQHNILKATDLETIEKEVLSEQYRYVYMKSGIIDTMLLDSIATITFSRIFNDAPTATIDTFTITFAVGTQGTGSMPSGKIASGGTYNIPANGFTANSGYSFNGWSDGTNTYPVSGGSISNVRANITLTAQWTATATAVNEVQDFGFTLYPNPVTDILTIVGTVPIEEVKIFDGTGKFVETLHTSATLSNQATSSIVNLSFSSYSAGIYVLHILTEQGITVTKIFKQ